MTTIRPATAADLGGIARIWNPVIRNTTLTFTTTEKTPESLALWLAEREAEGHVVLVAESAGEVTGFACYFQFRAGPGYARTMEHTVYVAEQARAAGLGRALMEQLTAAARARGVASLWAGCSSSNPGSIAFHAHLGFETIAVLPGVGHKFGQTFDLTLMRLPLD